MGLFISRFRKKKNTIDELEEIEQKIVSIEKFQKETEQQFRRVIGKFIISSVLIYVVTLCGYYYYFSPETFRENVMKFMPILIIPIAIFMFRKILSWYFKRKLSKNETTLKTLKSSKKKILDEVMDKEVYKVAKEILEKYAPEQLSKDSSKNLINNNNGSLKTIMPATPVSTDTNARHRLTSNNSVYQKFKTPSHLANVPFQATPKASLQAQPRLSLPRPILPKDRGAFEKLVDMIIGDGPGSRYALICRVCSSHNGMALKHEYEYLAFRCAYCLQWNPARKQKPQAPNLSLECGSQDDSDVNNSETEISESVSETVKFPKSTDLVKNEVEDNASDESVNELIQIDELEEDTCNKSEMKIVNATESVSSPDSMNMSDLQNVLQELKNEENQSLPLAGDSSTDVDDIKSVFTHVGDLNKR